MKHEHRAVGCVMRINCWFGLTSYYRTPSYNMTGYDKRSIVLFGFVIPYRRRIVTL